MIFSPKVNYACKKKMTRKNRRKISGKNKNTFAKCNFSDVLPALPLSCFLSCPLPKE
jgi:hypothetical protein